MYILKHRVWLATKGLPLSRVSFGRFELQAPARLLLADGVPVAIRNRAFDVLRVLVDGRNRVIGKAELIDAAWPGRVVEENNLSVQIAELRKVLGPTAIRTVAGRGYGLSVPVRVDESAAAATPDWAAAEQSIAAPGSALYSRGINGDDRNDGAESSVLLAINLDDEDCRGAAILPNSNSDSDNHPGDGAGAIRALLAGVGSDVILRHGGNLSNDAPDAFLAEFPTAASATACAFALQELARVRFDGQHAGLRMALTPKRPRTTRAPSGNAGSEQGAPVIDNGQARRLIELARSSKPGEVRADVSLRDRVVDGLDCSVEDLSELPAASAPGGIHAYRLSPPATTSAAAASPIDLQPLKPLIAIVPFESRQTSPTTLAVGELIADGLLAMLSHARHHWRLVSRLSTTAFRGRSPDAAMVKLHFSASFVVSGSYVEDNGRLIVMMQVADCRSGEVIVARRFAGAVPDLLQQRSELLESMLAEIQGAIFGIELQRFRSAPIPALRGYTLLLAGIQLLHRSAPGDFDQSLQALSQVGRWHPEAVEPKIWQAKWYALRAVQGRPVDLDADSRDALACTRAALEIDPNNAFALAMEGFVHVHLTGDLPMAQECMARAISQNPSETFAHLFQAVAQECEGDYAGGLASHEMALSTSPLDPARYLIDSIGASLQLGNGCPEKAILLAKSSLRANFNHAHSWRILTIAQRESGALTEARESLKHVLRLQPDLTVKRYLANARAKEAFRRRFADALQAAGLPL